VDDAADADIVARTLFGEARGEGKQGMLAVACVIVNRAIIAADYMDKYDRPHPLFGDGSLASTCKTPLQFSCWNADDANRALIEKVNFSDPSFLVATDIARQAEDDELDDVTSNATHYKRVGTPAKWAEGKVPCYTCGHQEFYNDIN
jgi:N-acetylmuramoyl-L-alanine amidase